MYIHDFETLFLVEDLRECLRKLSAYDQRILELFYFRGLTCAQIAAVLHVKRNAVLARLRRARLRLRKLMEGNESCCAA